MIKCKQCKNEFVKRNRLHKFCSRKCHRKYTYYLNREQNIKNSNEWRIKNHKPKIVNLICPDCNKQFIRKNNRQRFCSRKCCVHFFNNLNPSHKLEITRKWRNENREQFKKLNRERVKRKRAEDLNFKIRHNMRCRINELTKKLMRKEVRQLYKKEINIHNIAKALIINLPKDYNKKKYHIDHIIPLCSFDLTKEEDMRKAFAVDNHRWLLAEDNLKKGKKDKLQSIKYGVKNE